MPIRCLGVLRKYSARDRLRRGDGWRVFRAYGRARMPEHVRARDTALVVLVLERLEEDDVLALMEWPLAVELRTAIPGIDYPLVEGRDES